MRFLADFRLLDNPLPQAEANSDTLHRVLSTFFIIMGAVALLLIVIAGVRYIFARGEPAKVAEARSMISYSAIGLIIAALASVIVNFVIGRAT